MFAGVACDGVVEPWLPPGLPSAPNANGGSGGPPPPTTRPDKVDSGPVVPPLPTVEAPDAGELDLFRLKDGCFEANSPDEGVPRYLFCLEQLARDDAEDRCRDLSPGMTLATPDTDQEDAFVRSVITRAQTTFWLSGRYKGPIGWHWPDKTTIPTPKPDASADDKKWLDQQPESGMGDSCLVIAFDANQPPGKQVGWADEICANSFWFICEALP